ncbi:MAG: amino acid permease [Holosporaceae bacterium]|jgi:APA family basic amino acid/polyamine antiporter|nr:amino acid permease [Holosporaceae bacterium]
MYKITSVRATSLVAGNMIGSGVLLAPALLAPYGTMSLVGWCLTTLGALALALVFSRLSIWIPKSGGPYTFAKHVFGDFVGFQMAWGYWISAWCGSASLLAGALQYMSIFCPEWIANPMFSMCFGCSMIWIFTFFNIKGIKASTSIEIIITTIKILPLIIVAVVGIFFVDFSNVFNMADISKHGIESLGKMSGVLLWAFIGLESATIPADNVENPKRTIPLATISGVLIVAAVYICGAIVIGGVIPAEQLAVSKAPYVDAARGIFGEWGATIMAVTGIIGIVGSLNGWILIQGQVPLSAAEEGLFPKYFAKTNKNGAPNGVVVGSSLMTVLFLLTYQPAIVEYVNVLIDISVMSMLLPYFYSAIAFCYMAVMNKEQLSKTEKITLPIVGLVSILYTFSAIFGLGEHLISLAFIMFLVSVPFYCTIKKN